VALNEPQWSATALRYWEDLRVGGESLVGPCQVSTRELQELLGLVGLAGEPTGEPHSSALPDELLHSVAAGRVGRSEGYIALVCVRSATYRRHCSVHAEQPFFVRSRVVRATPVDERFGTIDIDRDIIAGTDQVASSAHLNVLVLRRASGSGGT
jgi:hypothetical protein